MISPYTYCIQGNILVLKDESHDEYVRRENKNVILERYFHDMYVMFLDRLTHFAVETWTTEENKQKLSYLLHELVKTKTLLEESGKDNQ